MQNDVIVRSRIARPDKSSTRKVVDCQATVVITYFTEITGIVHGIKKDYRLIDWLECDLL